MNGAVDAMAVVNALVEAFNRRDRAGVMALLDDGVVCHGIPLPPAHGLSKAMALLDPFLAAEAIDWRITAMAASGGTVLTERVDRFRFAAKDWTQVRAAGVFEVGPDGRITQWRDYFDMAELVAAMPGDKGEGGTE